jgi:hypothetical protein
MNHSHSDLLALVFVMAGLLTRTSVLWAIEYSVADEQQLFCTGQRFPSPLVKLPTEKRQTDEDERSEENKDQPPHAGCLGVRPMMTSDICANEKIGYRRNEYQRGKDWTQTLTHPQEYDAGQGEHGSAEVADHDHIQHLLRDRISLSLSN